jgi:hypothetical protein
MLLGGLFGLASWLVVGNHDVYVYCPSIAKKRMEDDLRSRFR